MWKFSISSFHFFSKLKANLKQKVYFKKGMPLSYAGPNFAILFSDVSINFFVDYHSLHI